jgi:hypothetical protein
MRIVFPYLIGILWNFRSVRLLWSATIKVVESRGRIRDDRRWQEWCRGSQKKLGVDGETKRWWKHLCGSVDRAGFNPYPGYGLRRIEIISCIRGCAKPSMKWWRVSWKTLPRGKTRPCTEIPGHRTTVYTQKCVFRENPPTKLRVSKVTA